MKSKRGEGGVAESGGSKVSKTVELGWAHGFSLENLTLQIVVIAQVLNNILSCDFKLELLTRFVKPLEVFSFDLEGECLVLGSRSILNFIQLVELSLKNDEFTSFSGHNINRLALVLLKSVNHLVEVLILQEETIIL